MEPSVFVFLLVAGVGFAIYLFYSMRSGYREGYQRGQAEAVAKGAKPWGKPMSHTFGSAYIMTPNKLLMLASAWLLRLSRNGSKTMIWAF